MFIFSRFEDWYYGLRYVQITNQLLTNVESRYDECSTRDFRTLQKYEVHSRLRCAAAVVIGLTIFKIRQYPNIKRILPVSPDILALSGGVLFYSASASSCMRDKTGDFLFPPPKIQITSLCQDARNFYKYRAPDDYVRLQQRFPAHTREDFAPKGDGYQWLARRLHHMLE